MKFRIYNWLDQKIAHSRGHKGIGPAWFRWWVCNRFDAYVMRIEEET